LKPQISHPDFAKNPVGLDTLAIKIIAHTIPMGFTPKQNSIEGKK